MSITVIYTKSDNSTMSDTFAFTRNLSQAEFDKLVLNIQEVAHHLPNVSVVTTDNLKATPQPESLTSEESGHRITRDIPNPLEVAMPKSEKTKKETSTKKAA